jgi:membrane-associated phospholipid phosphatase
VSTAPVPPDTTDGTAAPLREAVAAEAAPRGVVLRRTRLASLVTAGSFLLFAMLAGLVTLGGTAQTDLAVSLGLQQARQPLLTDLMVLVSYPGYTPISLVMVVAVVALFWIAGYRIEGLVSGFAALGIGAISSGLKLLWLRPRPENGDVLHTLGAAGGYSFPSGHTLLYVVFFGFLFYWSYAFLKRGVVRTALLVVLGLLIVLVGPSRVYLGHHWASDVLASYALGLACLMVLIRLYSALRLRKHSD